MSIDSKTIAHISKLARIALTDEEKEAYAGELSSIFDWIEQLSEVDTTGVEPMAGVGNYTQRLRVDEVNDGEKAKDVLKNAPDAQFDCFAVPKVVE